MSGQPGGGVEVDLVRQVVRHPPHEHHLGGQHHLVLGPAQAGHKQIIPSIQYELELETKIAEVYAKFYNHAEGSY